MSARVCGPDFVIAGALKPPVRRAVR
jgi:hypothetical protein